MQTEATGLPFVFAAWIANKELPKDFETAFNAANGFGLEHLDKVIRENPYKYFDLERYYKENIHYKLDKMNKQGMNLFLTKIADGIATVY